LIAKPLGCPILTYFAKGEKQFRSCDFANFLEMAKDRTALNTGVLRCAQNNDGFWSDRQLCIDDACTVAVETS
jgi:hypothetical protein